MFESIREVENKTNYWKFPCFLYHHGNIKWTLFPFVLPILDSLTNGPAKSVRKTSYERFPSVLVLLPNRVLPNQVYADFEVYWSSLGLAARAVYGGAPYGAQENKLWRGVDIAIGTQGRIKVI
ncbi:hypothetical protein TSUD_416100 [Trifolium subterraneum]|uniref:DEAD/DEAH-box helicase domain-containing protein n=1 Tax=Trifolium subterraneum TaxID=3900 RepID=A0A2Z6P602_TRISU|nr:hypothetical protein TSUD_416100 [Trifolium subterraneum]